MHVSKYTAYISVHVLYIHCTIHVFRMYKDNFTYMTIYIICTCNCKMLESSLSSDVLKLWLTLQKNLVSTSRKFLFRGWVWNVTPAK